MHCRDDANAFVQATKYDRSGAGAPKGAAVIGKFAVVDPASA